jgi:ligand-binding SRPBCC domain-containing protein
MRAPVKIGPEALLDYTLRWMGLPIRWRTRIIDWQPPRSFIDLQIKGPYTLWHHQHTFTAVADGTDCVDRVIYKLPMGWIGRPAHGLVRRQLLDIFRFRRKVIGERLGWVRAVQEDVQIRRL